MSVLSTFLALVAFSFLAFGTASAHTLNHRIQVAQTASTTTVVVRIITNTQGVAVYSPSAITIKSGTPVKIVNKTAFTKILFVEGSVVRLASRASMTKTPAGSETFGICGGGSLTITVV